nr:hypothetical protein Iba_chr12cCG7000 [Ipomoea batatas]
MNSKVFQVLHTDSDNPLDYKSLEEAAMADVTLLREGRHPPGNIYSFMKSELCLYSSYLSSAAKELAHKLVTNRFQHLTENGHYQACNDQTWNWKRKRESGGENVPRNDSVISGIVGQLAIITEEKSYVVLKASFSDFHFCIFQLLF